MVKQGVNFSLTSYSIPTLDNVDSSLGVYSETFADGDNFELIVYTSPLLNAVNFVLSLIGETIEYFGILKRWNSTAWVKAKMLVYNGTSWQSKSLKYYNGSEWLLVDTTGI
jgi:hypothetical protein